MQVLSLVLQKCSGATPSWFLLECKNKILQIDVFVPHFNMGLSYDF